jgi:hypothetical protein
VAALVAVARTQVVAVEQAHLVRVTMVALVLASQGLAEVAAALARLVVTHQALVVLLAQMVALVLRHQSQAHQSHALAGAAVVVMNLLV